MDGRHARPDFDRRPLALANDFSRFLGGPDLK